MAASVLYLPLTLSGPCQGQFVANDMQAQETRTSAQAISQTQSLAAVHTLLRASLGCITFLRFVRPLCN